MYEIKFLKKKGNKIDEATYNMTDNGDEQSTFLKEISKLCDFGIDMIEKGNGTSDEQRAPYSTSGITQKSK